MRFLVGVDIGGTFTDFVAFDLKSRSLFSEKVLTTSARPADAVIQGLEKLSTNHGVHLDQIDRILHATTLATNAVIERKGAKTGLLTTSGFEDVLDIGKGLRYNQYDLKLQFPAPYVPRFLRRGIRERLLSSGEIHVAIEESDVVEATQKLVDGGITSLAIAFLHSYANPVHELRAKEIVQSRFPRLFVSASHEVTSQPREYERTSTVVIDAYIKPVIRNYIEDLSKRLEQMGFSGKLLIMTCSGGMVETSTAKNFPVLLLESGPVAGVSMSAEIARKLKLKGIFSFDMGGTTAKGCVVRESRIEKSYEFETARYDKFRRGSGIPISIPVVRLIETGSGGGSIARVDQLGIVRVGPESAGANPGPACYALGGTEATVTDSDLALGYLDENYFLGGSMKLDPQLARKALEKTISARKPEFSVSSAAWAVHDRVNEDVASAFRLYASEIGVDYRKYAFIPFGGAGPVHAVRVAKKLAASKVVVPLRAGVLSAEGLLVSPLSVDLARTRRREISDIDYEEYSHCFYELVEKGSEMLVSAGVNKSSISIARKLDMCYHGQGYEVPVGLSGQSASQSEFQQLSKLFEHAYRAKYSISGMSSSIDITAYKVTLLAPALKLSTSSLEGLIQKRMKRSRRAYDSTFRKFSDFAVVNRYSLRKGDHLKGPALVQEIESTTVLPLDSSARVDPSYNLVVTV